MLDQNSLPVQDHVEQGPGLVTTRKRMHFCS